MFKNHKNNIVNLRQSVSVSSSTKISFREVLFFAKKIYGPDETLQHWRQLKFIAKSIYFRKHLNHLYQLFSAHQLKLFFELQPRILEKIFRPFLHKYFSKDATVELLSQHYLLSTRFFSVEQLHKIYSQKHLTLFLLDGPNQFTLSLAYDHEFEREGELMLMLRDIDNKRFYTLSFSLKQDNNGTVLVVGGIQGPSDKLIADKNDVIKQLTKQSYGMRPKALMVVFLNMLANHFECQKILAVRSNAHIYQVKEKHHQRIKTDYDELWSECGGVDHDKFFMELPIIAPRKSLSDIKSQKRSQYRSRYAWLDEAEKQIKGNLRG